MLTVAEAAAELSISKRKMYDLAASGEVACHRFGAAVRFEQADLDEYKNRCRSPATTRAAGSTNLTASSPEQGSGLTAYFRKVGREPKRKPTTSEKRQGSTKLQLVAANQNG